MAKAFDMTDLLYDILEVIIQCPVCLEITSSRVVHQCIIGHHICLFCRKRLTVCPTCAQPFSDIRNFVCEELYNKFEDIKIRLQEAIQARINIVERSHVTVSTQTEKAQKTVMTTRFTQTVNNIPEPTAKKQNSVFPAAKGNYYCCIGSCMQRDTHARLIWHIKTYHADNFFEFQAPDDGVFTKKLVIDNTLPRDYDYSFLIGNMGLFFVHFSIAYTGDFQAYIQYANSAIASSGFKYTLKFESATSLIKHIGQVYTCQERMKPANIFTMPEHSMIRITNGKPFTCAISIKREAVKVQPMKSVDANQAINSDALHDLISKLP